MNRFAQVMARTPVGRKAISTIARSTLGRHFLDQVDPLQRIFSSVDEARRSVERLRFGGHEHPDAISLHTELAADLRPSDYPALYWMQRIEGPLRIFDFGGNIGNLYYSYQQYLSNRADLAWTVYDLPAVVAAGRRIAQERHAQFLHFTDRPEADAQTTLLLVSGALHYWEQSVEAMLDRIAIRPSHILVNRTPMHERQRQYVTVQRQQHYAVPCVVRNAQEMVKEFEALGYEMINKWPVLELAVNLPFYPDWSVPRYSGFYFRRREGNPLAS